MICLLKNYTQNSILVQLLSLVKYHNICEILKPSLQNLSIMLRGKFLLIILCSFITINSQAQNKHYDWGVGIYGSLYSYSAVLESKMTSPYKYNRGTQISVSKYLNNNFDIDFNSGITTTEYYTGDLDIHTPYTKTRLYDASFNLKYKLDNGYIIKKENYKVSPFFKVGVGAAYVDIMGNVDVNVPAGFGVAVGMGKHLSFVYESNFRYNIIANNAYMTHAMGLKFNFMPVSKKRRSAQSKREKVRKLVRIEKRKEKRLARKERLANIYRDDEPDNSDEVSNSIVDEPTFEADPVAAKPAISTIVEKEEPAQKFKAQKEEVLEVAKEEVSDVIEEPKSIEVKPTIPPVVKKETVIPANPTPTKTIKEVDEFCVNSDDALTEIGKSINFDVNSDRIRTNMKSSLGKVINVMKRCEDTKFVIIAHTDSDGDADYNSRLAEKRASAVKAYLIENGIGADRLSTLAYGEYSLIEGGDKSSNRRVSFKINKTSF